MPLQQLPTTGLDDINHRRRHREITNSILTHQFDDSKVRTGAEIAASARPVNYAYPPGDFRRWLTATQLNDYLSGTPTLDLTLPLTNWLSAAGDLTMPMPGVAKITTALPVLSNTRIRAVVGATIRQYTANANVLTSSSATDISIHGLTLYAVGSMSSTFDGQGYFVSGCQYVALDECTVTHHRGFGVMLYNSPRCDVRACTFTNSPLSNSDDHTQAGGDIALEGNTQYCTVVNNECISGNGVGIQMQTINAGDDCSHNIVSDNLITDCKIYGINIYQVDPASTLKGNVVTGNKIKNITGAVKQQALGFIFGAGIYSNACQDAIINSNDIQDTHSASVMGGFIDLLAPGAIGLTVSGRSSIAGNVIKTCGMYGITLRNPAGAGPSEDQMTVANNLIADTVLQAIQLVEKGNVNVTGNMIDTTLANAIHVANTTAVKDQVNITGNIVKNVVGSGILVSYMQKGVISGNTIDHVSVHGIYVDNSTEFIVGTNVVTDFGSYGIGIDSTNGRFNLTGNHVWGNGSSTAGYRLLAPWLPNMTNTVGNCVAKYSGDYAPEMSAKPTTGTWAQDARVKKEGTSAGGIPGFICTTAGTPGTWKNEAAIEA